MNNDEWLEARRHNFGIGASDSPMIVGVSRYGGPWRVWAQHKAPHLVKSVGQAAHDGKILEPAVVQMFAERHGLELTHHEYTVFSHPRITWLRMSPDATEGPVDRPTGHFEIKVVFSAELAPSLPPSGEMDMNTFPVQSWVVQCLHQLAAVPSLKHVTLVALLPWFELRSYRLERGDDGSAVRLAIGRLARRLRDWRATYLVANNVPPVDDSHECGKYADWRNPAPPNWEKRAADRPTAEATVKQAAAAYEYADNKRLEMESANRAKIARATLLDGIGDVYRLTLPCGGSVKFSSHATRRITVDDRRNDA